MNKTMHKHGKLELSEFFFFTSIDVLQWIAALSQTGAPSSFPDLLHYINK